MNKRLKNLIIIFFITLASLVFANAVLALDIGAGFISNDIAIGDQDPRQMVATIINVILGFLGVIAIIIVIYAGWMYMTSAGRPDRMEKAKKVLIGGLIGLLIIFSAWSITKFVVERLITVTTGIPPVGSPCDCVTWLGDCTETGCLRCQNTGGPGVCTWQYDNTCPGCAPLPPAPFQVTAISPVDVACPVTPANTSVVNSRIRIYFNYTVNPASVNDVNILIESSNAQCPAGGWINIGDDPGAVYNTFGSMVEFIPDPAIGCPVNGCGATECFDINSTIRITIPAGGLQSMGPVLNVQSFSSNFFTNDLVDCQPPVVTLTSGLPQVCLDSPNQFGAISSDDSGISQVEFTDNNGNGAFPGSVPVLVPCPGPGLCGAPIPITWNLPLGTAIWQPTAALGYVAGNPYTITVTANDLDANTAVSQIVYNVLRPAHCCNGEYDPAGDPDLLPGDLPEEGVDCGGDCVACVGAECGDDFNKDCTDPPVTDCTLNNNRCYTGYCDCTGPAADCAAAGYEGSVNSCCLCKNKPIIDWIEPKGGFCSVSTNTACQNDGDCPPGESCDTDTPNGAVGNLITIGGRDFGAFMPGASRVYFSPGVPPNTPADWPSAISACPDTWTDNYIIVAVPAGAGNGPIRVMNGVLNLDDVTNDIDFAEPVLPDFVVNTIVRPGLCDATNQEAGSLCNPTPPGTIPCGYLNDDFHLQGINLTSGGGGVGGEEIFFGDAVNNVIANNTGAPLAWSNTSVGAEVPNLLAQMTTVFTRDSNIDSNPLYFEIKTSPAMGPTITYIDPDPNRQLNYITIYGSNFGTYQVGVSNIWFDDGIGVPVAASFDFPPECDTFWHDTYIVARVPNVANNNYDVTVVNSVGTSNAVQFQISNAVPSKPGLCKLSPYNGPVGQTVDAWGNNFGTFPPSEPRFYDGTVAGITSIVNASTDQSVQTVVPAGAMTGPFKIHDGSNFSNPLPFTVGLCTGPADCLGGDFCCPAGTFWAGICRTDVGAPGMDGECGAPMVAPPGGFGWNFSTSPLNLSGCSAILGLAECNDFGLCPNSPGVCQGLSGGPQNVGSCDCDALYGAGHIYDLGLNRCALENQACKKNELDGANNPVVAYCAMYGDPAQPRWHMDTNASCPVGWVRFDANTCIEGDYAVGPACTMCASGFSCSDYDSDNDYDCLSPYVCPSGASCNAGVCEKTILNSCSCCCRVASSLTDCCAGTTCVAGDCANDAVNYGFCAGCRVELNGNWDDYNALEQTISDAACNCEGHYNKFCQVDPVVFGNTGICVDKIPCDTNPNNASCNPDNNLCPDPSRQYCDINTCYCEPKQRCDDDASTPLSDPVLPGECQPNAGLCPDPATMYCNPDDCTCEYVNCDGDTTNAVCDAENTICTLINPDWECNPSTCICQGQTTPLGGPCIKATVPLCDIGGICSAPFQCIEDITFPPGPPGGDCRCCCDPDAAVDQCADPLECYADQTPCDCDSGACPAGNRRGLCCGCTSDGDCSNGFDGCAIDTCCRARPEVTARSPLDEDNPLYSQPICTNMVIKATFNEPMRISSFTGNVIVAGEYAGTCPANTTFMGLAKKETNSKFASILNKVKNLIAKIFKPFAYFARAYSTHPQANLNYCAIKGVVSGHNNTAGGSELVFSPTQPLEPGIRYYVIIKGDSDLTDITTEGVRNSWDIGMAGGSSMVPQQLMDWAETFNGKIFINAHIWTFEVDQNADICQLSYITIDPPSYLFTTLEDDTINEDDGLCEDFADDQDKVFKAQGKTATGIDIAPIPTIYEWIWSWSSDNSSIAAESSCLALPADNSQRWVEAQNKEGKTYIRAKATITVDNVFDPRTVNQFKEAKAPVYTMICENPWPPKVAGVAWQPWGDTQGNCTILPSTGPFPFDCADTAYELYYCRDAGNIGTADDLPAIYAGQGLPGDPGTEVIRGASLVCISNNGEIDIDGECPIGGKSIGANCDFTLPAVCDSPPCSCQIDVLKEIFYLREQLPSGVLAGINITSNSVQEGGNYFAIIWNDTIANAEGYKLYYGTESNNYSDFVDIPITGAVILNPRRQCIAGAACYVYLPDGEEDPTIFFTSDRNIVTKGVDYYFNITAYFDTGAESEYLFDPEPAPEMLLDTAAPFNVNNLTVTVGNEEVTLSWDPGFSIDVANYKVYYGTSPLVYGVGQDVGDTTAARVTGLNNGTTYYFAVRAVDTSGNESADATINTIPLAVPSNLVAMASSTMNTVIDLSWSLDPEGVNNVTVYYDTVPGPPYASAIDLVSYATTFSVAGLANNTDYYFIVKSVNSIGQMSEATNEANAKTFP